MSDPAAKTHLPPALQPAVIRPDKETFLAEENPFEAMMERFDHAAKLLKLDAGIYKILWHPEKQIIDVATLAEQHRVNARIAAYMLAVDRVAAMHRLRGMYA